MKPISGFETKAPTTGYPMLPKGLYVAKIKAVKLDGTEPDQRLILRIDITEGEYANYYTDRFKADQERGSSYEIKYKGDFSIQIPDKDNPKRQHYDWDLRSLNNAIWAIEDSNPGYHWDWNEQGLKGLSIGINVRQGTYNGSPYTFIGRLESLKMMAEGKCKVMADQKPKGSAPATTEASGGYSVVDDEEVPF